MKKVVVTVVACVIICAIILLIMWQCFNNSYYQELEAQQEVWAEINDNALPATWYNEDGYTDMSEWWAAISELKTNNINLITENLIALGDYLNEEQINRLVEIEEAIHNSHSINEINALLEEATGIIADAENSRDNAEALKAQNVTETSSGATQTTAYSGGNSSGGNYSGNGFKSQGVIYENGMRYTWYSSNVLHHYRTNEWTAGSDGIYRNSDGYIIVASDDDPFGSIVPTPFGDGIVQDTGAGPGTRDIYTNF